MTDAQLVTNMPKPCWHIQAHLQAVNDLLKLGKHQPDEKAAFSAQMVVCDWTEEKAKACNECAPVLREMAK